MAHPNDSVAHLIGNKPVARKPTPQTKKCATHMNINDHDVYYSKEGHEITSGDVQSVAQHVRSVELQAHRKAGLDTEELERPARGLGVRTSSEDFVAGDED